MLPWYQKIVGFSFIHSSNLKLIHFCIIRTRCFLFFHHICASAVLPHMYIIPFITRPHASSVLVRFSSSNSNTKTRACPPLFYPTLPPNLFSSDLYSTNGKCDKYKHSSLNMRLSFFNQNKKKIPNLDWTSIFNWNSMIVVDYVSN